jgi:hypothetical protein
VHSEFVIEVVPLATAVTTPELSTVATPAFELLQVPAEQFAVFDLETAVVAAAEVRVVLPETEQLQGNCLSDHETVVVAVTLLQLTLDELVHVAVIVELPLPEPGGVNTPELELMLPPLPLLE